MGLVDNPTTLATVILCESVLQYLPTCETHNTQYATLRAYGVTNRNLAVHGRLTLDATQVSVDDGGRLQVTTPSIKKVWLPLGSLPKRALNATRDTISFLDGLGGRTRSVTAAAKVVEHLVFNLAATKVIVNRTDLKVLRPNKSMTQFKTVSELIYNVIFEEQTLPSSMIVKATIRMAKQVVGTQHLLPELKKRLLKTITHFRRQ